MLSWKSGRFFMVRKHFDLTELKARLDYSESMH